MQIPFQLAGAKFRGVAVQAEVLALTPESKLSVEREPSNVYDSNAIKVLAEGVFLGYVPKNIAAEVAPMLDAGEQCDCLFAMADALSPHLILDFFASDPVL